MTASDGPGARTLRGLDEGLKHLLAHPFATVERIDVDAVLHHPRVAAPVGDRTGGGPADDRASFNCDDTEL
jgi:hypothetical protein